ncbi:MAG TPA: hypothetical protein VIM84_11695 [Gemmatimonadales bacterium]
MNERDITELRSTVERIHGCPASYRTSEEVRDQGRQIEVAIFDILGHPRAMLCYAWLTGGSGSRRTVTVLREGLVRTSLDAVRFALEMGE